MMNTIGIGNCLDWKRIRHLFRLGIVAAVLVLVGDMLLGWGTADPTFTGMDAYFSKYLMVSDARIFWSALLGLVGIPIEVLSYFGVYRLMADRSSKHAHAYRAGIFGMLIFGALVHVMCCAVPFYFKKRYMISPDSAVSETMKFAAYFLLPATGLFVVFFFLTAGVQISAFAKGKTPYPKWCAVFSFLFGFVVIAVMKAIGDYPLTNALSTGWISLGSIFMLCGLLFCSGKAERI